MAHIKVTVTPVVGDPNSEDVVIHFSDLKGKQAAIAKLFQDLSDDLADGKLDPLELIGLAVDLKRALT